jgi:WD40 repeat protein
VILWDLLSKYVPFHLQGHYNDVIGCCFSPDGALLATASLDTRVIIWDALTGQSIQELGYVHILYYMNTLSTNMEKNEPGIHEYFVYKHGNE